MKSCFAAQRKRTLVVHKFWMTAAPSGSTKCSSSTFVLGCFCGVEPLSWLPCCNGPLMKRTAGCISRIWSWLLLWDAVSCCQKSFLDGSKPYTDEPATNIEEEAKQIHHINANRNYFFFPYKFIEAKQLLGFFFASMNVRRKMQLSYLFLSLTAVTAGEHLLA